MKIIFNNLAIVLVALVAAFNISTATAAGTFTGSLTLASQAEVDAFDYDEVTGSLTISGADIDDLAPLDSLITLGGSLSMGANPSLTDPANAFAGLTSVGGGIFFYYTGLSSFNGFDALVSTGDNIDFWYNDDLNSVTGFSALQTAGWSLEFGGNPLLTQIPDFPSLVTITSSLYILDNVSLTRVEGLDSLQDVGWSFQVIGNTSLSDACGFYPWCTFNPTYGGGGSFLISDNALPNDPYTIDHMVAEGPCTGELQSQVLQMISDVEEMNLSNGLENKLLNSLENTLDILEKKGVE